MVQVSKGSFADLAGVLCCSARDAFLQEELQGGHEEVLLSIAQCSELLVNTAAAKLQRWVVIIPRSKSMTGIIKSIRCKINRSRTAQAKVNNMPTTAYNTLPVVYRDVPCCTQKQHVLTTCEWMMWCSASFENNVVHKAYVGTSLCTGKPT